MGHPRGAEFDPGTGVITLPPAAALDTRGPLDPHPRVSPTSRAEPDPRSGDHREQPVDPRLDYFSFGSDTVQSTLGDGLTFVGNGPHFVDVFGDDPTTVVWDFGALGGNEEGGTRRSTSLVFAVDETYANDEPIHGGDIIPTRHTLSSALAEGESSQLVQDERDSGTDASVQIVRPTASKSVYLINGAPPPEPLVIRAGDVVTFRLQMTITSGDQRDIGPDFLHPRSRRHRGDSLGPTRRSARPPTPAGPLPRRSASTPRQRGSVRLRRSRPSRRAPSVADLSSTTPSSPAVAEARAHQNAKFQRRARQPRDHAVVVDASPRRARRLITKGAISSRRRGIFTTGRAFPYHSTEIMGRGRRRRRSVSTR